MLNIYENFDPMADDPANYKLGIFYFNRKDKRTIVPKRNRFLGWTINFARPYVYWEAIIIVAIIIFELVME
jgi:uncharacterized membrane protein